MKLYYAPQTRATRPRWMLEEIGAPYELVRLQLSKGEHKQPEHLKIHPHGAVPAFSDDEVTMFESAAICAYLAGDLGRRRGASVLRHLHVASRRRCPDRRAGVGDGELAVGLMALSGSRGGVVIMGQVATDVTVIVEPGVLELEALLLGAPF